MKKKFIFKLSLNNQNGSTTLLTAVVLLFVISIVGILTAKSILIETQTSANNYRANQALNAANAAMDYAIAYFSKGGMYQKVSLINVDESTPPDFVVPKDSDGSEYDENNIPCPNPPPASSEDFVISSLNDSYARFYFDKDECGGSPSDFNRGMAIAHGWSDDCTAKRTIRVCLDEINPFAYGGPKQPFVSKAGVGLGGNGTIINRFNNSSVWAGGQFNTSSAAISTYLRPNDKEIADFSPAELISPNINSGYTLQEISDRASGFGYDIIADDATLKSKTSSSNSAYLSSKSENEFFAMFFSATKQEIINFAKDRNQYFTSKPASWNQQKGLIWVDGDLTLSNSDHIGTYASGIDTANNDGSIGLSSEPVILIVNGNLTMTDGTIHGIIYVVGNLRINGGNIYGSLVSEYSGATTNPTGNPILVYRPFDDGNYGSGDIFLGGAVIPGSWKDW